MKTRILGKIVSAAIALVMAAQPALAAVPQRILYQGTLRQTGGLYTGNATFVFRITNAAGGTEYWNSGSTVVAVTAGLFRYPLGMDNPGTGPDESASFLTIDWSNISPYIEVTVNGNLLSPREEIHSVPYAIFNSAATDMVNPRVLRAGDSMTGQLTIANSTLTVTGDAFSVGGSTLVVKDGRTGIGTNVPQARLSVEDSNASTVIASKGFLEVDNSDTTDNNTFSVAFRQNDLAAMRQTVASLDIVGVSHAVGAQSGSIVFGTRNAGTFGERLRIGYDGSVGIGVSNPSSKLHVIDGDIRVSTSVGQPDKGIYFQDGTRQLTSALGGNLWASVAGSSIANTNSGNVGVGTNDPDVKLHVVGNMHIDTSGTSSLTRNVTLKSGGSALDWASYGGGWAPGLMIQGATPAGADSASEFLFLSALDDTQPALIASSKDLEIYTGAPIGSSGSRSLFMGSNNNVFLGVDAGRAGSGTDNALLGYRAGYSATFSGNGNVFLGSQAGQANTSGSTNEFIGYQAGLSNLTGGQNAFIGYQAGYTNTSGASNTFLGNNAGYTNNASLNTFVGAQSGYFNNSGTANAFFGHQSGNANTSGSMNAFIGNYSGASNLGGSDNTALGYGALISNTAGNAVTSLGFRSGFLNTASSNTFVGYQSGRGSTTGLYNTFVGNSAGFSNGASNSNTAVGYMAGYSNSAGAGNVFLGYQAGYNETGSNKLVIANSNTSAPLIWGDFGTNSAVISGSMTVVGTGIGGNAIFELAKAANNPLVMNVTNTDGGAAAYSELNLRNDTGVQSGMRVVALGAGFTTSDPFVQDAGAVISDLNLSGGLSVGTRAAAPLRFYTSGAEYMRIASDGKVGIGLTNAGEKLEVSGGNIKVSGSVLLGYTIQTYTSAGASGRAGCGAGYMVLGGGCSAGGNVTYSAPSTENDDAAAVGTPPGDAATSAQSWSCTSSAGVATAYAICARVGN